MEGAGAAKGKVSGDKAPVIVQHLQSAVVKDGEPVILSCRVIGNFLISKDSFIIEMVPLQKTLTREHVYLNCIGAEKFDVVWLHNDKEIKPSKDFQHEASGDNRILKISEIFPEDSGTYTCEAFNDAGEAFSSCTLAVTGKLHFDINRSSYFWVFVVSIY
jgi:hypothetical protein